jgi:hypothetical protein
LYNPAFNFLLLFEGARLQDLLEVVAVVEEAVLVVAVVDSVEEVPQGAVVDLPGVEGVDSEDAADIRI